MRKKWPSYWPFRANKWNLSTTSLLPPAMKHLAASANCPYLANEEAQDKYSPFRVGLSAGSRDLQKTRI